MESSTAYPMLTTTVESLDDFSMNHTLSNLTCTSRQKPLFLIFCAIPSISIVINVVVLVAVLRKTRKLMRQSHVYAHVNSTLLANVLFSILGLLQLISLYVHFGGHPEDPNPARRGMVKKGSGQLWTFLKAFLCGMFIIICGNIGLLIDSIRHTTCLTLRTAAGYRSHQLESGGTRWKKRLVTRRQRSYILIAVLWIVPIVYVLLPFAGWSCAEVCKCLSQCFPSDHRFKASDYRCSRAFPPMANSWMAVVVIGWACLLLGVIFFLKRSIQQVTHMWTQCHLTRMSERHNTGKSADENPENPADTKIVESNDSALPHKPIESLPGNSEVVDSITRPSTGADSEHCGMNDSSDKDDNVSVFSAGSDRKYFSLGEQADARCQKRSCDSTAPLSKPKSTGAHRRMMDHLRATRATTFSLRYVIWMTASFGICTAPTMIFITVDMCYPGFVLNMVALNTCFLCPYIYCYMCPFILVKCLPGVKTSLSALILSVYSTTDK
uniref:G-protein coupled receptors family 1 profile domain-containing protein n=1 Tax=Ciona savignyi TaxID=51511 RepID=H2Z2K6_CIOSA